MDQTYTNGDVLEQILNELNFCIQNNKSSTLFRIISDYYQILHIFLCSSNLFDKVLDFKVLEAFDLTSEHFPISICLSSYHYIVQNEFSTKHFNFKLAKWDHFSEYLENLLSVSSYIKRNSTLTYNNQKIDSIDSLNETRHNSVHHV